MTVISYTLNKCVKCMKCLQKCPVEAIHIKEERVHIVRDKCINCGKCIEACRHAGITAKGSTLVDLQHYKKSYCLIPSAIYGDCVSEQDARRLNAAIQKLGFDEIVSLAPYEGAVYEHVNDVIDDKQCYISSFCPVINQLIATRYPMLVDHQVKFDYPAILAAKQIRKEHPQAGIFLLCECPSKLALGKYPYGNTTSEIDHCLSIVDVFPQINANRSQDEAFVHLTACGIKSAATGLGQRFDAQILSVNGIDKVQKALELAEFGLLKEVRYLSCSACYNGCIGGQFLWGNPFNGRINMHELLKEADKKPTSIPLDEIMKEASEKPKNFDIVGKMKKFQRINATFEQLPGFDCGACGFPTCRSMAEAIVEGTQVVEDCKILQKERK